LIDDLMLVTVLAAAALGGGLVAQPTLEAPSVTTEIRLRVGERQLANRAAGPQTGEG
jgi:hypothetical protein